MYVTVVDLSIYNRTNKTHKERILCFVIFIIIQCLLLDLQPYKHIFQNNVNSLD